MYVDFIRFHMAFTLNGLCDLIYRENVYMCKLTFKISRKVTRVQIELFDADGGGKLTRQ